MGLKQDIPEGCEKLPRCAFGRILSVPRLRETYWTVKVLGLRIFYAAGNYGGPLSPRRGRFWWSFKWH